MIQIFSFSHLRRWFSRGFDCFSVNSCLQTVHIYWFSVKTSVGCKHTWIQKTDNVRTQSICTMCEQCCEKGDNCEWNGIMPEQLRHCECQTQSVCCHGCGICIRCVEDLWVIRNLFSISVCISHL